MYSINCKGKLLLFDTPLIMGILNATPDSFATSHLNLSQEGLLALAGKMIEEGAEILDIGGQSTRPGSERISVEVELQRVIPVIKNIHLHFPGMILSIDTYNSEVARAAIEAGASIVNDISGGNFDEAMLRTVAALQVPYICMHMQGTPATMQNVPAYNNVITEVLDYFIAKLEECKKAGIKDVIFDPGFGFGKSIDHNFELLRNLQAFSIADKPILVGLSRKSTIYKTLGITVNDALNGSTVLHTIALLNGASILRVHDVKEAREAVMLYMAYKTNAP